MIYTHIAAAVIAVLAAWAFQDARYTAELAEQALTHKTAELDAVSRVRSDERAITKTYQGALNAARDRETLLRTELDDLHAASNSLRAQLADAAPRIAAAPPAADAAPAPQLYLEIARTQAHLAEGRRGLEQVDQLQHVLVVHRLAVHRGSLALKVCGRTGRQEAGPVAGSAKHFDERNS